MNKVIFCPKCNGLGYTSHCENKIDENGVGFGRAWSENCNECDGKGTIIVPMTNGDYIRVRAMNDEELANVIHEIYLDGFTNGELEGYIEESFRSDVNKIKEWIKEPVGENDE